MTYRPARLAFAFALAAGVWIAGAAAAAWAQSDIGGETVSLPGIRYQVLAAEPGAGAHPSRADRVTMRYVGRLESGEIFSTSPDEGRGVSTFAVGGVIPGASG